MKKKWICVCIVLALFASVCCFSACGGDTVKSLSVKGQTAYIVGDDFAGATLTVVYADGKREQVNVTADMTSGFDTAVAGNKTVVVKYKEKIVSYEITVSEFYAASIAVADSSVTDYLIGSAYTDGDAEIIVLYTDGSTETVAVTADMISRFDTSQTGKVGVSVTYGRLTASYTISVRQPSVTSIAVNGTTRLDYRVGDAFDSVVLDVVYEDGAAETVVVDDASAVQGFDTSAVGKQTVRASYRNQSTTFEIEVQKAVSAVSLGEYTEVYGIGDAFDRAALNVTYADGTGDTVDVTEDMLNGFDTSSGGSRTVSVDFEGRSTLTFDIRVYQRLVTEATAGTPYKAQAEDENLVDMSGAVLQSGAAAKFENTTQKAGTNEVYSNGAEGYSTSNISVQGNKITIRFLSEISGTFRLGLRAQSGSNTGKSDVELADAFRVTVNENEVTVSGTLKAACASGTAWKDMTVWTELTDIAGEIELKEGLNTVEFAFLGGTAATMRFPNIDYFLIAVAA